MPSDRPTRRLRLPLAAAALALGLAAPALAAPAARGQVLGTTAGEIEAALAKAGCELVKFERNFLGIEVYCREGRRQWEMLIDSRSGAVRAIARD